MKVSVHPKLIIWAIKRAHLDANSLKNRFTKLPDWINGTIDPTLKQLEDFAKTTHVPVGTFFLSEPPQESLPIPDFRTMASNEWENPSPDLLETIYLCQQKQDWYKDYMQMQGSSPFDFIGKTSTHSNVTLVAEEIRQFINFDLEQRNQIANWTEALRLFIELTEKSGILVMTSGVVGSNNKRKLNPEEFRGFALVDSIAPIIFINAVDTKAAQMFTLAHELAHIWLGISGVSNTQASIVPDEKTENWCNQVAAELLVPLIDLKMNFTNSENLLIEMENLARRYKVSTLVILRRIFDLGAISRETLWQTYNEELNRLKKFAQKRGGGGDFYRTLGVRVSKRFTSALVSNTLEGQTLYRDAYKMLGIKKSSTFHEVARKLGMET